MNTGTAVRIGCPGWLSSSSLMEGSSAPHPIHMHPPPTCSQQAVSPCTQGLGYPGSTNGPGNVAGFSAPWVGSHRYWAASLHTPALCSRLFTGRCGGTGVRPCSGGKCILYIFANSLPAPYVTTCALHVVSCRTNAGAGSHSSRGLPIRRRQWVDRPLLPPLPWQCR